MAAGTAWAGKKKCASRRWVGVSLSDCPARMLCRDSAQRWQAPHTLHSDHRLHSMPRAVPTLTPQAGMVRLRALAIPGRPRPTCGSESWWAAGGSGRRWRARGACSTFRCQGRPASSMLPRMAPA